VAVPGGEPYLLGQGARVHTTTRDRTSGHLRRRAGGTGTEGAELTRPAVVVGDHRQGAPVQHRGAHHRHRPRRREHPHTQRVRELLGHTAVRGTGRTRHQHHPGLRIGRQQPLETRPATQHRSRLNTGELLRPRSTLHLQMPRPAMRGPEIVDTTRPRSGLHLDRDIPRTRHRKLPVLTLPRRVEPLPVGPTSLPISPTMEAAPHRGAVSRTNRTRHQTRIRPTTETTTYTRPESRLPTRVTQVASGRAEAVTRWHRRPSHAAVAVRPPPCPGRACRLPWPRGAERRRTRAARRRAPGSRLGPDALGGRAPRR
jgi:hypothetical protein